MPARSRRSPTGEPCAYLVSCLRPRHQCPSWPSSLKGLGAWVGLTPRQVGLTTRSSNFRRFSQLNPIRAYLHQSLLPCFPSIGSNLCCRSFPGVGSLGLGSRDIPPSPLPGPLSVQRRFTPHSTSPARTAEYRAAYSCHRQIQARGGTFSREDPR